eukprot:3398490-Rhodomonas_salina.1
MPKQPQHSPVPQLQNEQSKQAVTECSACLRTLRQTGLRICERCGRGAWCAWTETRCLTAQAHGWSQRSSGSSLSW